MFLPVEWDSVFEVTVMKQIEQLAMDTDNISHIGVTILRICNNCLPVYKANSVLAL